MRRIFDIAGSAAALVFLSPLLAVLALAVLASSGRPVLFRQIRVGRGGATFTLLKFRSMHAGSSGAAITAAGDARITRIGRVLRRYKLDELPQLWNILRGEMSFIGPRPEVPAYVDAAAASWQQVLRVRPGLTDLATLLYRDEEQLLAAAQDRDLHYREVILPAKLELNLHYLRNRSLLSDLRLLCLTAVCSFVPWMFSQARIQRAWNPPGGTSG